MWLQFDGYVVPLWGLVEASPAARQIRGWLVRPLCRILGRKCFPLIHNCDGLRSWKHTSTPGCSRQVMWWLRVSWSHTCVHVASGATAPTTEARAPSIASPPPEPLLFATTRMLAGCSAGHGHHHHGIKPLSVPAAARVCGRQAPMLSFMPVCARLVSHLRQPRVVTNFLGIIGRVACIV